MTQRPGQLPPGVGLDDLLTVEQFAVWIQQSEKWVRLRLARLPGVIRESREVVRIHVRTYLAKRKMVTENTTEL